MYDLVKKSIRGAIAFGIVGALCAVALPAVANLLGPSIVGGAVMTHAAGTSVAWTTMLFAAFGLFVPGVEKVYDLVAGGAGATVTADAASNKPEKAPAVVKQVHLHIGHAQQNQREDHVEKLKERRMIVVLKNDQTLSH